MRTRLCRKHMRQPLSAEKHDRDFSRSASRRVQHSDTLLCQGALQASQLLGQLNQTKKLLKSKENVIQRQSNKDQGRILATLTAEDMRQLVARLALAQQKIVKLGGLRKDIAGAKGCEVGKLLALLDQKTDIILTLKSKIRDQEEIQMRLFETRKEGQQRQLYVRQLQSRLQSRQRSQQVERLKLTLLGEKERRQHCQMRYQQLQEQILLMQSQYESELKELRSESRSNDNSEEISRREKTIKSLKQKLLADKEQNEIILLSLQAQNKKLIQNLNQLEAKCSKFQTQITSLTDRKGSLEQQVDSLRLAISKKRQPSENTDSKFTVFVDKIQTLQQENLGLRQRLELELKSKDFTADQQLSNMKMTISIYQKQFEDLNQVLENYRVNQERSRLQINSLKKALLTQQKAVLSKQPQLKTAVATRRLYNFQVQTFRINVEARPEPVQSTFRNRGEGKVQSLQFQEVRFQPGIKVNQRAELQRQIAQLQQAKFGLESQLQQLRQNNRKIKLESIIIQKKLGAEEEQNKVRLALQAKFAHSESMRKKMEGQLSKVLQREKDSQNTLDRLHKKIKDLEQTDYEKAQIIIKLNDTLKDKQKQLTRDNSPLNTGNDHHDTTELNSRRWSDSQSKERVGSFTKEQLLQSTKRPVDYIQSHRIQMIRQNDLIIQKDLEINRLLRRQEQYIFEISRLKGNSFQRGHQAEIDNISLIKENQYLRTQKLAIKSQLDRAKGQILRLQTEVANLRREQRAVPEGFTLIESKELASLRYQYNNIRIRFDEFAFRQKQESVRGRCCQQKQSIISSLSKQLEDKRSTFKGLNEKIVLLSSELHRLTIDNQRLSSELSRCYNQSGKCGQYQDLTRVINQLQTVKVKMQRAGCRELVRTTILSQTTRNKELPCIQKFG